MVTPGAVVVTPGAVVVSAGAVVVPGALVVASVKGNTCFSSAYKCLVPWFTTMML